MNLLPSRRWLLLLVPAGILAAAYAYYTTFAEQYLEQAIAEIDRLDPGWRIEEMEASRAVIAEEKNSAQWVRAAAPWLSIDWLNRVGRDRSLARLPPQQQLNEDQRATLSAFLAEGKRALPDARRLSEFDEGRFPLDLDAWNGLDVPSHVEDVRRVAVLLGLDAVRLAQESRTDEALSSCRAALNAGRSLGDEPIYVSQFTRMYCLGMARRMAERVLAQGQPSEESLKSWQVLLQLEQERMSAYFVLRAERAGWHEMLKQVAANDARAAALENSYGRPAVKSPPGRPVLRCLAVPHVKQVHADLLRYMTGYVEATRLPAVQQDPALTEWDSTAELPLLMDHHLRVMPIETVKSCRLHEAQLRCALAAVATERFRRERKRWPRTLTELCPNYLKTIPDDPYGGPLRFRRVADGVIIYSIGPDLIDDGGKLARINIQPLGTDFGFQLWDVAHRRQPSVTIFGPPLPGR